MIGSRFEVDASKATCRLAFYGRLAGLIDTSDPQQMRKLRIFKIKRRSGSIDRVNKDGLSAVCKGMFKKETDISVFAGLKVIHAKLSGFLLLAQWAVHLLWWAAAFGMSAWHTCTVNGLILPTAQFPAGGHAGRPHRHHQWIFWQIG